MKFNVLNVQQKMAAILVDGERQTKKITMLREETKRYWTFLVVPWITPDLTCVCYVGIGEIYVSIIKWNVS